MDHVFSTDPAIIVVEVEDDEQWTNVFHVYLEGVNVGTAYSKLEATAMADEVFASVTGEPQEEGDFL